MANVDEQLQLIENSMRAVGRNDRKNISISIFDIFISSSDQEHLTFSVPLSIETLDYNSAILEMVDIFVEYKKRPRLEFIQEIHYGLDICLEKNEFICDGKMPVMVLTAFDFNNTTLPNTKVEYMDFSLDKEEILCGFVRNQSIAFGGNGGDDSLDWLPYFKKGLMNETVMGKVTLSEGKMLSGAVIQIGENIGELAGVWSSPMVRGKGYGYSVCHNILTQYFDKGYSICWLSAAEGAQKLYEKLGFKVIGHQCNYSLKV